MAGTSYGHVSRCLILNKRTIESPNLYFETNSYEFKVWNYLTEFNNNKNDKKNYLKLSNDNYRNIKKYRKNLLKIAELIDILKEDTDFKDIAFIAPLFATNPEILINNLDQYDVIRKYIISKQISLGKSNISVAVFNQRRKKYI